MVPNIIHFIFGLEKKFGNRPFSIFHYLAIKSAYEINEPDKIYFYYKYIIYIFFLIYYFSLLNSRISF